MNPLPDKAREAIRAQLVGTQFNIDQVRANRGRGAQSVLSKYRRDAMRAVRALKRPDGSQMFSYPQIGRMFHCCHTSVLKAMKPTKDELAGG